MPNIQIGFLQPDNTVVPDGNVVKAISTDGHNTVVEVVTIGANNVAPNEGVGVFMNLVPGTEYQFTFTNTNYASHTFSIPDVAQIVSGADGPQGPVGPTGPQGPAGTVDLSQIICDIAQTFEFTNQGPTTIFTYVASRTLFLEQTPTNGGAHVAYAAYDQASQDVVFNINQNGNAIGTLTFNQGNPTGVFVISAKTTINPGDFLSIDFSSSSDSTAVDQLAINNFIITLCPTLA